MNVKHLLSIDIHFIIPFSPKRIDVFPYKSHCSKPIFTLDTIIYSG